MTMPCRWTACWRPFRAFLQTSARNQWFGTITGRDRQQVQQHVEVLLADGQTRLNVAITAQSAERWASMRARRCWCC
jgi:molybdopterin-binding protein